MVFPSLLVLRTQDGKDSLVEGETNLESCLGSISDENTDDGADQEIIENEDPPLPLVVANISDHWVKEVERHKSY